MGGTDNEPAPVPHRPHANGVLRRLLFSAVFLLTAGVGNLLFADYLWRSELYGLKYVQLALFFILFTYLAFSFTTTLFGFLARSRRLNVNGSIDAGDIALPDELPPTAILFPIYNEDVPRVMAGLRATWKSLQATGLSENFDFFILSDTRNPDRWVEEEVAWLTTCRELGAFGRIHYRHRRDNVNKKAGNISQFLGHWGRGYRYMVIFDADSMMTGDCLTRLVALMETRPRAGVIQTVPRVVGGVTPYARAQQFASALYGPVFAAGLNYWQQADGNYWGHNAIIRIAPFMEHCELPVLPWREPLGGKILSHDFVEAALMRRAGYEVWLAHNLGGSYEEGPPNPIDAAERDRRWCQGNLQHTWLLFARGFSWGSRIHLLNGILSYLNAFFWFWFLLVSTLVVVQFVSSDLTLIATPGFFGFYEVSLMTHGLLVMGLTALLLFSPKILAVLDLLRDGRRRRAFGGFWRAAWGSVTETLFTAFLAPLNMLWHATFIVTIPMGRGAAWDTQNRASGGLGAWAILRILGWMVLLGVGWSALALHYGGVFFSWIAPVLLPLVAAVPFVQFSASPNTGDLLKLQGVWTTPEETTPPDILHSLKREEAAVHDLLGSPTLPYRIMALQDPYTNALHVSLEAETGELPADYEAAIAAVEANLDNLASIPTKEFATILACPAAVRAAHRLLWTRAARTGLEERRSPFTVPA